LALSLRIRICFTVISSAAAMSGPGNKGGLTVVGLILVGTLRTGAASGRHPKVPCGWNLRVTARWHGSAAGPARGAAVPAWIG
jgi:hypothetical protein